MQLDRLLALKGLEDHVLRAPERLAHPTIHDSHFLFCFANTSEQKLFLKKNPEK
jgi:hypothetical protein